MTLTDVLIGIVLLFQALLLVVVLTNFGELHERMDEAMLDVTGINTAIANLNTAVDAVLAPRPNPADQAVIDDLTNQINAITQKAQQSLNG